MAPAGLEQPFVDADEAGVVFVAEAGGGAHFEDLAGEGGEEEGEVEAWVEPGHGSSGNRGGNGS